MSTASCLQAGEILAGKFCVERIIATGGVGVVVAARHLQLGETVALKFLIPQADRDATDVARFVREAQSAVKLKNEHVARVLDVGSLDDGAPFMVMEYLEGSDLDQIIRHRGPLSIPDAVDYVLQACEAIAEAHQLGIVHRDIKPSNFFLTKRTDGSPLIKVLDFGIAKARADLQQDISLTKTRTVLGSPVYMSPEQIRSARSVDHRTDIWSLGVTLYEILTDQLPFDGDSITGVAAAVSIDSIAPIRSVRPEIPIGLSSIVEQCLEKKPADRYQTVADFAAALVPYGPESARYSLTRIRGALGLKSSDPGSRTLSGSVADNPDAESNSTAKRSLSETMLAAGNSILRRKLIVGSLLLLAAIVLVLYSARTKQLVTTTPRPALVPAEVRHDLSVGHPSVPRATVTPPVDPEPKDVQAPANTVTATATAAIPLAAQAKPPSPGSKRKAVAAASSSPRGGTSKSPSQKSSATKESSGPVRYEAIFDTRK